MITRFSVKNYKCLADVSLPLTKLHVIIGQNDTGKTSLFEAIQAFSWGATGGFHINDVLARRRVHQSSSFDFYKTKGTDGHIQMAAEIDNAYTRSLTLSMGNVSTNGDSLKLDIHGYRFNPSTMKYATAVSVTSDFLLNEDGFGLATYLDALQKYSPRKFIALGDAFRKYFPAFNDIALKPTGSFVRPAYGHGDSGINAGVEVVFATSRGELSSQSLSDGAVLLLAFLALTYSPKPPSVLLIEEPENGIHPKRLIEVAKLLREFTEREQNAPQIILTTHSPLLLSEFQPEEVTLMRREKDGSAKAYPLRNAEHIHERMQDKSQLGELWYYLSEDELLL